VQLVAVQLVRFGEVVEDGGVDEALLLGLLERGLNYVVVRDRADRKLLSVGAARASFAARLNAAADARPSR
jgi:hypothetical protein